ncbi:hypothetical protein BGZ80_011710 [Entomortierella chlamydospora]|uniref:F-box domain-containing protein n=1 Tax=Entomortierella chlamydospora TaxID=101097 RepID=A0A9P6MTP1_9FUNG|nr:hypothetical protein BGZ79_011020 [Entomortierella chlamydospora]KAG0012467.1 hypothetical protein BGZ80_011710 [Entomortierella chlamydospora]
MNAQNLPPEILEHISLFIECRPQISRCARVCRAWHATFIRSLFYKIDVQSLSCTEKKYPTGAVLGRYCHLIRSVNFQRHFPPDYLELGRQLGSIPPTTAWQLLLQKCQLFSLIISQPHTSFSGFGSLATLISNHASTLTEIQISFHDKSVPIITHFWNEIAQCTQLQRLTIRKGSVIGSEAEAFTQACSTPTTLEIYGMSLLGGLGVDGLKWPRVKRLCCSNLLNAPAVRFVKAVISRCSNLKFLYWSMDMHGDAMRTFSEYLAANTWPLLDSLHFRSDSYLQDSELFRVLDTLTKPLVLLRAPRSDFSTLSFNSMRGRGFFTSIRDLNLNRCLGVTSAMIQEILSSCPLLEVCFLGRIRISDIICGKPWICGRMRNLCINIDVDSAVNDPDFIEQQHKVFKQLSVMKLVEKLAINHEKTDIQSTRTLDLRLESGLGLLTGFSQLKEFWFKGDQRMTLEDVHWLANNFKRLRHLSGRLHVDEEILKPLKNVLTERGISVYDGN